MSPWLVISFVIGYFLLLMLISFITGRDDSNSAFFLGNRKSPWYIVAFGMIGASLSGVTFISVPGWVGDSQFGYMQVVLGYLFGYAVISFVLMPLYYRLNLVSIYSYLGQRFGVASYKTGAAYFLLSRVLGASFRLFLVATVLYEFVLKEWGIPFPVTVIISVLMIWLYTFRGGIKTIIWTDTLQTFFMLAAMGLSVYLVAKELGIDSGNIIGAIADSDFSSWWTFGDIKASNHFVKQFIGGAFVAIGMTGLDQDMMQKNLSCRDIGSAQKNMVSFSVVLLFVNLAFLGLGALLWMYAAKTGITLPLKYTGSPDTDMLYPTIALNEGLGLVVGISFLLGLIAAAYSSADSALTSLTTSFCIDFLDIEKRPEHLHKRIRMRTHVAMGVVLVIVIILFRYLIDRSVIDQLLRVAAYTYGPLLGLFFYGILTKRSVTDKLVPVVCLLSPAITFFLSWMSGEGHLGGYKFGYELILVNGIITFVGLAMISGSNQELSTARE